ncbi:hypothetical protein [Crateriforma spongiae]|uniref:hypothetical protein n=1 Tax=Crateriforma spongiae TaxID=2724528 RepID=UPI00144695E4|nr:hypothetical protein [Crateriforma spongiae]
MSTVSHTSETPSGTERPTNRRPRRRWSAARTRGWIIALTIILTAGGLFFGIRLLGYVEGEELSPDTFRQRSFQFYEIPFLQWQITPIRRKVRSDALATYLRQNGLIQASPASQPPVDGEQDASTWHLIRLNRFVRGSSSADAALLVDQMDLDRNGKPYWKTWSTNHPEAAKQLWPEIQRLARRELYILMPGVFEIAQRHTNTTSARGDALNQTIRRYVAGQYDGLIQDAKAANNPALADELLREALADDPEFRLRSVVNP